MEIYIVAAILVLLFLAVVIWGVLSLISHKGGPNRYEMYEDHEDQVAQGEYRWAS